MKLKLQAAHLKDGIQNETKQNRNGTYLKICT